MQEVLFQNAASQSIPREFAEMTRLEKIGGLDALLDVLQSMVVPDGKLPEVLAALQQLIYRHALISEAIENLAKRLAAQPAAVQEAITA